MSHQLNLVIHYLVVHKAVAAFLFMRKKVSYDTWLDSSVELMLTLKLRESMEKEISLHNFPKHTFFNRFFCNFFCRQQEKWDSHREWFNDYADWLLYSKLPINIATFLPYFLPSLFTILIIVIVNVKALGSLGSKIIMKK